LQVCSRQSQSAEEFCNLAKPVCRSTNAFCNIAKAFCNSRMSYVNLQLPSRREVLAADRGLDKPSARRRDLSRELGVGLYLRSKSVHCSFAQARTGLRYTKLIVPDNLRFRKQLVQCPEHLAQRHLLCLSSVVLIAPTATIRHRRVPTAPLQQLLLSGHPWPFTLRHRKVATPLQKGGGGGGSVSPLIAHPNREAIIALHMTPPEADRSGIVASTVPTHIDVISRIFAEATLSMTPL